MSELKYAEEKQVAIDNVVLHADDADSDGASSHDTLNVLIAEGE